MKKVTKSGIKKFWDKNASKILTGCGIAGSIAATIFAVDATPKAIMLIEQRESVLDRALTKNEVVKACWKCYIPTAIAELSSVALIILGHKTQSKKYAALATAYKLSETALIEYKNKLIDLIGEDQVKGLATKIADENFEVEVKPELAYSTVIPKTPQLFKDAKYNQICFTTEEEIQRAVNRINYMMLYEHYACLNDFYEELGMAPTEVGYDVGWNLLNHGMVDVYLDGAEVLENGKSAVIWRYRYPPKEDYQKTY